LLFNQKGAVDILSNQKEHRLSNETPETPPQRTAFQVSVRVYLN